MSTRAMPYDNKVHPPPVLAVPAGSAAITQGMPSQYRSPSLSSSSRIMDARAPGASQAITVRPQQSAAVVTGIPLSAQELPSDLRGPQKPASGAGGSWRGPVLAFLFGVGLCSLFYFLRAADEGGASSAGGEALSSTAGASMTLATAQSDIANAIARGAPMYNNGDIAGCARVYAQTASEVVQAIDGLGSGATAVMKQARTRLQTALTRAENYPSDHNENAWALRHAFDAVTGMVDTEKATLVRTAAPPAAMAAPATPGPPSGSSGGAFMGAAPAAPPPAPAVVAATSGAQVAKQVSADNGQSSAPVQSLSAAKTIIQDAINTGVPMYNAGDKQGCARVYAEAAERVVKGIKQASAVTTAMQAAHDQLESAWKALDPGAGAAAADANAWTLRGGFDAVLGMAETDVPAAAPAPAAATPATPAPPAPTPAASAGTQTWAAVNSLSEAQTLIQEAISVGVPLYNSGDKQGCARVYAEGAEKVVNGLKKAGAKTPVMQAAESRLEAAWTAMAPGAGAGVADENAWALRFAFDAVLAMVEGAGSTALAPAPAPAAAGSGGKKLTALVGSGTSGQILNDGVMGGLSSSRWSGNVFSGTVRTENNGGFASVRFSQGGADLRKYAGFYIKGAHLSAASHSFTFTVQDSVTYRYRASNFKSAFQLPSAGGTVYFAFSDPEWSRPESYGYSQGARNIDLSAIMELGIQAAKPTRDFSVRIEEIGVYEG